MKRWFGIVLSIVLAAACVSGPYPAPHAHPQEPTRGTLAFEVVDDGGQPICLSLSLHTGEVGWGNADGYVKFDGLVIGPRHVTVHYSCDQEGNLPPDRRIFDSFEFDAMWPAGQVEYQQRVVIPRVAPRPPPFVSSARPLVGPLRVENKLFRDDTGNRRVFFNSWFTALRVLRDNPTEFYRQLDAIAAAGYQGSRVFLAVGGWMDFWDNHEVVPIPFTKWFYTGNFTRTDRLGARLEAWPNYDELYRTLLREYKKRGLRLHVTTGDMQIIVGNERARELALHERLATIAAEEGGTSVIALVEATNEIPFNRYAGTAPESIEQMGRILAAWRARLPGVLTAQGAIPQDEEPASLELAGTHGQVVAVHVTRSPVAIALKRSMGLVYWEGNYRGFRLPFWEGEPAGDGDDSFDRLDDRNALTALYAIHALTGQASNQFSGPSVRSKVPLESVWSFAGLPKILAVLPEDIATWSRETAGRGAILYWIRDKQFATATFAEWDSTPPRPVAEWTLYAGDRVDRGTGTPPNRTGLLVGRFQ